MKTTNESETSDDPAVHSTNIQKMLSDLIGHMRADVKRVQEPRFQALIETSAEVLTGLKTAFTHYDRGDEAAWKR
jgi:hypothetical protein